VGLEDLGEDARGVRLGSIVELDYIHIKYQSKQNIYILYLLTQGYMFLILGSLFFKKALFIEVNIGTAF
jgi:hypothetical protein